MDSTTFYDDAQRYDIVAGALSGARPVEFYRKQARQRGSPVLELACGTGRLSIPIAKDGLEVVGLDPSLPMLALAEQKAAASGVTVTWVPGDMRTFHIRRRFSAIFIASNSFSHLYTRNDIEACLASVRRHLAPSGRFVLDLFNPAFGMFLRRPDHRFAVTDYEDPNTRCRVAVSKAVQYDSATQINHETWYFRDDATASEQTAHLNLRMFFPQEIDALLHYNGFRIEKKYGDYNETPFADSSRKQIIVCSQTNVLSLTGAVSRTVREHI